MTARVVFDERVLTQISDVGSIPIARSINPDDSVDLTRLSSLNWTKKRHVLDGVGRYSTQLDGRINRFILLDRRNTFCLLLHSDSAPGVRLAIRAPFASLRREILSHRSAF